VSSELTAGPARLIAPRRTPRRTAAAVAALLLLIAVVVVACGSATPTLPFYTEVPIGPTALPAMTVGQYGLHIDPSLLGRLPASVDAYPIVEDPQTELLYLDDSDLAKAFDRYAAARVGEIGDDNWLALAVGHFKADSQNPDAYQAWVDQQAADDCSQADGVASTTQETINFWLVDEATCTGGPIVYSVSLQNGVALSILGFGPLDLGRKLIDSIYN
jgi:hypothetical protein